MRGLPGQATATRGWRLSRAQGDRAPYGVHDARPRSRCFRAAIVFSICRSARCSSRRRSVAPKPWRCRCHVRAAACRFRRAWLGLPLLGRGVDTIPVAHPAVLCSKRHLTALRPSHRSRRRQPATHPSQIEGLTTKPLRAKNQSPAGRLKRATSCRNSERHDRGMTGRHRRNHHSS